MCVFKDHTGKISMMRVGFFVTLIVGSILCVGGLAAIYYGLAEAGTAIASGSAMMTGSGFAKSIQSKWEKDNGLS